jgi:hypothetical protein
MVRVLGKGEDDCLSLSWGGLKLVSACGQREMEQGATKTKIKVGSRCCDDGGKQEAVGNGWRVLD